MRKNLFLSLLVFASTLTIQAQTSISSEVGVNFNEGKTFSDVLAMAKKDSKSVFMDCFTTWCGPCRMMANNEFPKKEAGDYFNSQFICWKVDMEKGEGIELAKRYDVHVYPTFLILDGNGNLEGRVIGYSEISEFIQKVENEMKSGKRITWYQKQYSEGNRDAGFIQDYMELLVNNYMRDEAKKVAREYLSGKSASEIVKDKELYNLFSKPRFTPADDIFISIYKERVLVSEYQGLRSVEQLDDAWKRYVNGQCMTFEGKEFRSFDEGALKSCLQILKENQVPRIDKIEIETRLLVARYQKDYPTLCGFIAEDQKNGFDLIDDNPAYQTMRMLVDDCIDDEKIMKQAKDYIEKRLAVMKQRDTTNERTIKSSGKQIPFTEYMIPRLQKLME